jgi:hypothetical protein
MAYCGPVDEQRVNKPSDLVGPHAEIRIKAEMIQLLATWAVAAQAGSGAS